MYKPIVALTFIIAVISLWIAIGMILANTPSVWATTALIAYGVGTICFCEFMKGER